MSSNRGAVSSRLLFIWLLLAGFTVYLAPQGWTGRCQLGFAAVFCRPVAPARAALLAATGTRPQNYVPRDRYLRLRNRLANVTAWLNEERRKVHKLSGLRDRPAWSGVDLKLADVINTSAGPTQAAVIINRGTQDGVKTGQFVMAEHCIVGTVATVARRTAEVRLVTDPSSKIGVQIRRDANYAEVGRVDGGGDDPMMMCGAGDGSARINLIVAPQRVPPGSIVFACKQPGLLETPVVAGTVVGCERDPENPLLWTATVKPACDLSNLKEVAVIVAYEQP